MDITPRRLCLLGATGSVGSAALAVVREHPEHFSVGTLVANVEAEKMAELAREFSPALVVLADEKRAEKLSALLAGDGIHVDGGAAAVLAAAASPSCCTVVAAIAGAGGVESALAAATAGKRLLLANKEALIVAGELLLSAINDGGGELLPVDSEHCALFELLAGGEEFKKLWLTASGGAVRDLPLSQLESVTPDEALRHPNWSMGRKITVDSATMMNKVLEIMEAAVLFRTRAESIGVVMHPQSVCHAMVEYSDGALVAAFSLPDMRLPLARMMSWPARLPSLLPPPDWDALSRASFAPPDVARYPCLPLAARALGVGGGAPAALSAANEVAVERFLAGEIKFTDIARINAAVLDALPDSAAADMEALRHVDQQARQLAARPLPR